MIEPTCFASESIPDCALSIRFFPSNANGVVNTATVNARRRKQTKRGIPMYPSFCLVGLFIPDLLKASDPMRWVQMMNNIKASAEEIVLKEVVYK